MRAVLSNVITVDQTNEIIMKFCEDNLVIDNPEYLTKLKLGKWLGNTPSKLYLYEKRGDKLIIPFGCRKHIEDILDYYGGCMDVEYIGDDIITRGYNYHSNIELYPYQQKVSDTMVEAGNGIIVMPCGSGKTQTALHCVARLCGKTLWLTHTQDLLNQSMNRAKQCFDCDKSAYGTITAGKVDISDGITFATVQTMCKLDLSQYRKEWDTIIVDECQHCCGTPTKVTQFYKVINSLYAMNKFGLTATPKRSDGLDKSMYALLGDIIIEVDKDEVSERTCPVKVKSVETGYFPDTDSVLNGDGTINYTLLTDNLINDDERFSKAVAVINTECRSYSMVLANRVSYLQRLQEAYKGKSICLSALGTSKQAKEERKEALRKLNDGEIDCLFATYQLAAEGLDCPNLKYVVFATPEKNERTVTQAVGRVARKADGKEYGTVIDFVDGFGMYKGWAKKRIGYYKKLGCDFV